jgi:Family of unknown function (DUF6527)
MTTVGYLFPTFVEFIPHDLEPGILYVSMPYATAAHLCACGCGGRTITPLSPVDWRLSFDGESVSLWPSIGNWGFLCQSHYWIRDNRVVWSRKWTSQRIRRQQEQDRAMRTAFFARRKASRDSGAR